ncbi:hypothetical protein C4580_03865 [Candidatus Woesearchaeota archaeon]|nr:MAG: hypothetical protein C4580_03865 [Candidatus Woesearchaeota archaeon]
MKKNALISSGLISLAIFAVITITLLFGNNAGWWSITEGPVFGVALVFGWPFIIGSVVGGLSQMSSGSEQTAVIISFAGLVLNIIYAFAVGAAVGYFVRKR